MFKGSANTLTMEPAWASTQVDAQAVLTIDLDALAANWQALQRRAADAECAAVVKADAYGTGIEHAVPALARAGCRTFFTAHAAEGARARASLRDAGYGDGAARVFILHGFHPALMPVDLFGRFDLSPVIGSGEELRAWTAARPEGGRCALHVDTGMNRLGFSLADSKALDAGSLAAANVDLLMSHFTVAETPSDPTNAAQIARFEDVRRGLLGQYRASLSNSSGFFLPQRPFYDLVRPGYALYGGNPTPDHANPMRPVVGLEAPILQTRWIAAGEAAGYNGRWVAARRTRLATIGVGYADGLPRNAMTVGVGEPPVGLVGDVPCPLVGRVSMDLSILDITDAPDATRAGTPVRILGPEITVDDLGARTNTIGYEILTNLGRRYRRHYVGGSMRAEA